MYLHREEKPLTTEKRREKEEIRKGGRERKQELRGRVGGNG